MNKTIILFLLSIFFLPLHMFASERVGGWNPIRDVKDPHVVKIGQFAVSQYNIQSQSGLKFMNVVRGEFQVVSGINYKLVVEANDGNNSADRTYEAVVFEQPSMKSMNLTSFTPLLKNSLL
ncbi:cysteine proteinase inhibitor 5-like [Raphanus sativus]|uniref:Cysteine proteinase inhibitor 5-like n=1 Tax=Raphanus sativus TaxID=3726 RepID=A0A6J0L3V8_RAPSA|nr:cysteine proteinase inhibitor 5-like [Raphanus sativus]XP_056850996.1 cysteine proteinase inhibitor 5-like [Raphanus sativus]